MATKQEGEQDDSEGDEKREHVPRRNVVNLFFTSFPPEWSKVNMYELFSEVGEIADVYVARKLSKAGKRFGFARFFRVGNIQSLEKRLNRISIGSFKLKVNIAKYEKSFSKSNQGCKRDGWVLDIPPKLHNLPSSSFINTMFQKPQEGEYVMIHSLVELQPIWSCFNVTDCKVKYMGGSIFSLEFRNKEEELDLNQANSESAENIAEIGIRSKVDDGGVDSIPIKIKETYGITMESGMAGKVVTPGHFPASTETDGRNIYHFPAQAHKAEILKFESRVGIPCTQMDEPAVHATNEHEMSPSNIGEKEMSTSNIGERVDIKPRPSDSDLKKIIAYSKTLRPNMSNEEIREGFVKFQSENYLSPSQKAAPIKKKKMRTVNLFDNAQNFFCKKSVKGKKCHSKTKINQRAQVAA
ncbi:nucleotide-binding alpha-beta plait domain-containing protein [Tanacetum coccineum]|uniref:Nucleotide-binding alpha-beta plait domain-containing protein n=1 Tax=Tanacetum coccineum TaxID=301880 RepID=A0ABQ5B7U0_9ASTR